MDDESGLHAFVRVPKIQTYSVRIPVRMGACSAEGVPNLKSSFGECINPSRSMSHSRRPRLGGEYIPNFGVHNVLPQTTANVLLRPGGTSTGKEIEGVRETNSGQGLQAR